MADSAEIRQRKPAADSSEEKEAPSPSAAALAKAEDHSPFNWLDIARSLVFLVLLSGSVSYFVTGESFLWNLQRPKWTQVDVIRSWIVRPIPSHPLPFPSSPFPYLYSTSTSKRGEKLTRYRKDQNNTPTPT